MSLPPFAMPSVRSIERMNHDGEPSAPVSREVRAAIAWAIDEAVKSPSLRDYLVDMVGTKIEVVMNAIYRETLGKRIDYEDLP